MTAECEAMTLAWSNHRAGLDDHPTLDHWCGFEAGWKAAIDAHLSRAAEPVATNAESKLAEAGVFKGQHGLRGLLGDSAFWERQPYGTRLYYGDGIADYLHRDVLDAAVKLLDTHPPEPARDAKDAKRFHWLLENCSTNGGLGVEIFIGDEAPDAEDLIERIDAAMAQESGDGE